MLTNAKKVNRKNSNLHTSVIEKIKKKNEVKN
jgi:hypothetical protein